jgi:hypothetical protein
MVRIQLETGYLDVKESSIFPINYGVADIRDISKRSGTFSKTITLAGTSNNHALLNHYYDVNIVAGTFNINTLTPCQVIQNGIPIGEDFYIQLISVNKVQVTNSHEEEVEYSVLIKDQQADFFTKIDNALLEQLDFTDLNHTYNSTNVIASFNNTVADGYVYPMAYSPDNNYQLIEFKPAIYAKLYWDRIHAEAGYTYEWTSLSDCLFDKAIIPFNGDVIQFDFSEYLVNATLVDTYSTTGQTAGVSSDELTNDLTSWTEVVDAQSLFNPSTGEYDTPFYVNAGQVINYQINVQYDFNLNNSTGSTVYLVDMVGLPSTQRYQYRVIFQVYKNGSTLLVSQPFDVFGANVFTKNEGSLASGTTTLGSFSGVLNLPCSNLLPSDILTVKIQTEVTSNGNVRWKDTNSSGGSDVLVDYEIDITALDLRITPSSDILEFGATVQLNDFIPKQIKQKDFIKSICNMYNLYVEPDATNPNKLIYQHRDDFYDSGATKDWTLKLAKDKQQVLQFLPELSAKKMQLSYKDDKDEPNTLYKDSTNETYGQLEFTFDNEYVRGIDRKELIFSPTPMGVTSFGSVVPLFNGIAPKTNIRILLHNGTTTSGQYNIYDYLSTGTFNQTTVPLISHFDDHYNPTFDINFGICDYYFYDGINVTNNNLYNLYWRRTIGQINDGKMLTAYFDLKEMDIQSLRLNDKIRIDNSWWHINRVIDYDANSNSLTNVELMSVDSEIDLPPFRTRVPVLNPLGTIRPVKEIVRDIYSLVNVNLSPESTAVTGFGNVVVEGVRGRLDGQYKTMIESSTISDKTVKYQRNVKYTNADYQALDRDDVILVDGAHTVTLPSIKVVNGVYENGIVITLTNINGSNATIDGSGGERIDGSLTKTLHAHTAVTLISAEGNWFTIG